MNDNDNKKINNLRLRLYLALIRNLILHVFVLCISVIVYNILLFIMLFISMFREI